jgi:membrane protease YdiL (CAAX protease family)
VFPGPEVTAPRKLLAPVWHTVLIVLIMLLNSYGSAKLASGAMGQDAKAITENVRVVQYAVTIVLEFFLLFLVWIGLRLNGTRIQDVIGGRWGTAAAFWLDVAIAIGFAFVAYWTIFGLSFALGLAKQSQIEQTKKLASMLAPHTWHALLLFVLLSTIAGFVEEIIFRGYLQKQFAILSGNVYAGLIGSALIFGAGHGYEGARRMVLIFILGLMFGYLALWRKSLRPGMIGHAMFDSAQGVALFIATKIGFISAV